MKINFKFFTMIFLMIFLMSENIANAEPSKIAVVDIQKVVSNSKQVKILKDEQYKKATELEKWLDVARKDIEKQSTEENKQKLIKKYDTELARKKDVNSKEYAKKLSDIDSSVSKIIIDYAKSKSYDLVLVKSNVLFGGIDITQEIIKQVK